MSVCAHCIMHACDICVLFQYIVRIVSDCISMLRPQLHTTIILSARFVVPCPAPAPAVLLTTCSVLSDLYDIVSTRDSAAGALSVETAALSEIYEHKRVCRQCRECREFGGVITCKHERNSAASSRVAHACGATLQVRRDWGYRVWHVPY